MRHMLFIVAALLLLPSALFGQARVNTDKRYGSYSFINADSVAFVHVINDAKFIEGVVVGSPQNAGQLVICSGVLVKDTVAILTQGATTGVVPFYISIQARVDSASFVADSAGQYTIIYQTER